MNKYGWLLLSLCISIITTFIAGELEGIAISEAISNSTPETFNISLDSIQGFFNTYWRLLTFQVTGIPAMLQMVFMVLNIIIGFIIVEGIVIPAAQAIIP